MSTEREAVVRTDSAILDWLEGTNCYWVTVQTEPHGVTIFNGCGKGLRAAVCKQIQEESHD